MNSVQKLAYLMLESKIDSVLINIKTKKNIAIKEYASYLLTLTNEKFYIEYIEVIKDLVYNENSPYYTMINNIFNDVDYYTIKKISLSIGYLLINQHFAQTKRSPKSLVFEIDDYLSINIDDIAHILYQAESIGINTAEFFSNLDNKNLRKLINMLSSHQNSIYLLYLNANHINPEIAYDILKAANIIVCLKYISNSDFENNKKALICLREKKCLVGVYTAYENSNISYLINGNYFKEIACFKFPFTILIESNSLDNYYNINEKIQKFKQHPFIIFDYYSDLNSISKSLNIKPIQLIIKNNGKIAINHPTNLIDKVDIKKELLVSIFNSLDYK